MTTTKSLHTTDETVVITPNNAPRSGHGYTNPVAVALSEYFGVKVYASNASFTLPTGESYWLPEEVNLWYRNFMKGYDQAPIELKFNKLRPNF